MSAVQIVEVGPRDGFQNIGPFIPTQTKIAMIRDLAAAGLKRMEVTSFVSARAIPQLCDAPEVLADTLAQAKTLAQVLVPNARYGLKALEAGATFLSYVFSISESHNRSNVRASPEESLADYARLVDGLPAGTRMRLNLATSFDCPFEGRTPAARVLEFLERAFEIMPEAEICLCDTTGRGEPDQVGELFAQSMARCPEVAAWAMHAHDTYGRGADNVLAAHASGVRIFDAAIGGLGGCPYAPGASGNVATEDVVRLFHDMGVQTGVDAEALLPIARRAAALPGANAGSRCLLPAAGAPR
ncbi:hydroxymethylglutaryl-CoA lyase [Polymorphum gilvum]|uniref:Possible hydroxymethylglutaryl-CoA lyase n=1 Tax=Polymorphum gilvum (strain LMG 25793 / CGMCC 1.9160 / SL003B-26A1) TaxID=991905 RepID=F2J6M1_POLGS|nr:hydroxymethylglutaryl-CoA lyase [Polymorphum gilvum]ADZ72504.1 Possible hydroxymethylglutaryl-CoA lyase [Polymorphum gilvum SL003B-26A1]